MKKPITMLLMSLLIFGGFAFSSMLRAEASPGPPIVGLWTRTVTDANNNVISLSFQAYHSDRTETINSSVPPSSGNVCLGVWTTGAGGRTFKLEHTAWVFDSSGQVVGTFRIRDTVTVDPSGETYNGTSQASVCDPTGANCNDFGTGNVQGLRRHVNF